MIKPFNIFIDHDGEANVFVKKLKERLKRISEITNLFTVTAYIDVAEAEAEVNGFEDEDEYSWVHTTISAIENSDIVIPIITSSYLSFSSQKVDAAFDEIINSNDKYLFPILLKPCDWGGVKWVVKSKLIPSDNTPISEYSDEVSDSFIDELVKTIDLIVSSRNKIKQSTHNADQNSKFLSVETVFISHDHDDADFAELLQLTLEKYNMNGWIDSERLKIGQDWRAEIDESIVNSVAVIVIMTPEARKSEYVTYEWAYAWGKGIKIFPIMLKQTQLHPRLESLQYLDFTNRLTRPWDKLIDSIKELSK